MIEPDQESLRDRQVAALCYRKSPRLEILLVTSRETRRWVTPKGWPMKGRRDHAAAAVEAFEEAGVDGVVAEKSIGTFDYDKVLKTTEIRPVTAALFPLEVIVLREDWPEKGQRDRRWFTPAEAAVIVQEPKLAQLILAFGGG
ncbi:MAG: NUDIX hydrolase [Caulobacter sp.]|nr:NUDIX hydrolase [Caulobacter sp.]